MEQISAIGRRKAVVARVYLTEDSDKVTISKKDIAGYFPSSVFQFIVKQPLVKLKVADKYDTRINLTDGSLKGRSETARLGVTRALIKINPEGKATLRATGLVTRDPRVVERKEPGRPGTRKRFQFSKR